jgi:hypothetical protein
VSVTPFDPFDPTASDPGWDETPNEQLATEEVSPARANVESDARVIAERVYDRMAERFPGWVARDGDLTTWLIDEMSTIAAEVRGEALTVPEAIYQTYGEGVLGIPIGLPRPATGLSTWTAVDDLGYELPVGLQFTLARTGDDLVAFEVAETVAIVPGDTAIENVPIRALEEGQAGNGLTGQGDPVDPLRWVDRIQVDAPTGNGLDGQTLESYLTELISLMRVVALRPILPADFAVLALRVPGIARAVALDGYRPTDHTWGHARTVTLVVTDPDGEPPSNVTLQAVSDYLESLREVNWRVFCVPADYQAVDVGYEVTAFAQQDPAMVEQLCTQAVADALAPARFRLGTTSPAIEAGEVIPPPPPYGEGGPSRQTLRVNDMVALLDRQRGVDFVVHDGVLLDGQHDDLQLDSPVTLPRPGQITGVVNTQ